MLKIRTTILTAAVLWAWVCAASGASETRPSVLPRVTPIVKPTLAQAAAARAAALSRAEPHVVPADLPKLTAQQIVDRNTAARGGLPAWQRVRSMTLAGKLDAGRVRKDGGQVAMVSKQDQVKAKAELRKALAQGKLDGDVQTVIQLPFQMDLQRPTMTRLEVPFQGQTAVQVYDGAHGWKLRPFLGRHEVEPFTADELKLAASQQELDGPLIDAKAKGTEVEVEGGEMLEGRGAYRLRLTSKTGDVRRLWVDAKSFVDVKIEGTPRHWDGKMRTVTTWYRDYRTVDGLQIAHRLETRLEGVPGSENVYIDKVALNPPLDGARFAKPQ